MTTLDRSATLDPRALEEAARVKCRLDEEQMLLPDWDDLDGDQQDALRGEAEQIITAYLDVTQLIYARLLLAEHEGNLPMEAHVGLPEDEDHVGDYQTAGEGDFDEDDEYGPDGIEDNPYYDSDDHPERT